MGKDFTFITNEKDKKLKKRIIELIANSQELKFLVGFFYFSGIRELYQGLKSKPEIKLKVLVGLEVDKFAPGILEYAKQYDSSDEKKVENFFSSVKHSINNNDFDSKEFYEQVTYFIDLIQTDRLLIRKTYDPNHAKLYIFKITEDLVSLRESVLITGSSNLTRAGLQSQGEFNVEISDYGTKEAEEFFDKLWDEAVVITEDDAYKEKLIHVLKNNTLLAQPTPFEAFALVLKHYLETQSVKDIKKYIIELMGRRGYKDYTYQRDAVKQALSIIEHYNGVLIADVVGLGKSVISSIVAKQYGKRGIIICPPGLIGDDNAKSGWKKYVNDFRLNELSWEVRSSGNLEKIEEYIKENDEIEVILIDEAHRFRNQDTKDYETLTNICRGKIVILLTATPFNNSPADIFSLLKLFSIPKQSLLTLDGNLEGEFRDHQKIFNKLSFILKNHNSPKEDNAKKALAFYKSIFGDSPIDIPKVHAESQKLSNNIRTAIEPIIIRRNRLDLKNDPVYSEEIKGLPVVKDPKELFFELSSEQSLFYDAVIDEYFGEDGRFKGAIYQPFNYEKELTSDDEDKLNIDDNREFQQQRNLYEFMRRLLVKRFESSFGAFAQSISNFISITEKASAFIAHSNGKYILDRKLLDKICNILDEDVIDDHLKQYEKSLEAKEIPKNEKVYDTNKFAKKDEFFKDIESDLELLKMIKLKLVEMDLVNNDPKVNELCDQLLLNFKTGNGKPIRKVIIFSEYKDTVIHIEKELQKHFDGKYITVKGSLSNSLIENILQNFDASYQKQVDQFDILLTTDKIAEGFNLNRAGTVINYDIPWNPTRVIQRVGRINRINKMLFKELHIYNFFPTEKGADVVKSRQIASNKMFIIHNTLGEDAKIFSPDETPTPAGLFKKIQQNPEEAEDESLFTRLRRIYREIEEKHPEILAKLEQFPSRIKTTKRHDNDSVLVYIRKGLGLFVRGVLGNDAKVRGLDFAEAIDLTQCEFDEPRLEFSNKFWDNYELIKNHKEKYKESKGAQSIDFKARSMLKTLLKLRDERLEPFTKFMHLLLEDMMDYKTLSPYTLRVILHLSHKPKDKAFDKNVKVLQNLQDKLGLDFLEKSKKQLGDLTKEVIIAIENVGAGE